MMNFRNIIFLPLYAKTKTWHKFANHFHEQSQILLAIKLNFTMQLKFTFLSVVFLFLSVSFISAQSSASVDSKKPTILSSDEFSISPDEWTFYLDKENKVYYIDFESINVNLNDIRVYDQAGELVKSDKLWDLPVNTIYELNIGDLKPGNYKIELRSYTGLIEKEIILSE